MSRNPVVDISQMLDASYPPSLDPEAWRWRRCLKASEEVGELTEALLGLSGENPRKGITHTLGDVRKELLDVALAALGAVAHLDGNTGDPIRSLEIHAEFVRDRLARAINEGDRP